MDYDVLVLGGGIIGCAVAYELSKYNLNIAVIEKEFDIADDISFVNTSIVYDGSETSNNVMAGLEYIGNILLEDLCEKFNVPFKRIGSLRVVNDDNGVIKLKEMYERAIRRGIDGVYLIEPDEVYEIEPHINAEVKKGLYSQNVAIVAPYDLAIAYAEVAFDNYIWAIYQLCAKGCPLSFTEKRKELSNLAEKMSIDSYRPIYPLKLRSGLHKIKYALVKFHLENALLLLGPVFLRIVRGE